MAKQDTLRQAVKFIMHAVVALDIEFPILAKDLEERADKMEALADEIEDLEDEN